MQGIVGNIPGQALAFQTLYLQLLGLTPAQASLVVFLGMLAHAGGGYLGGYIGDVASRIAPRAGRIAVCQFSVLSGAAAHWMYQCTRNSSALSSRLVASCMMAPDMTECL